MIHLSNHFLYHHTPNQIEQFELSYQKEIDYVMRLYVRLLSILELDHM